MPAYSKDMKGESLLQLSQEVSRIAGTLAQLSTVPSEAVSQPMPARVPEVSAKAVGAVIRARRQRSHYFPDDLFADPAWDILLELLHADASQRRVTVSNLCHAAAVPATTALRWVKAMERQGFLTRRDDPCDARRVFVELTPETSLALNRYFAEVNPPAAV